MAYADVKTVYRAVIDEVTTQSRPEFVQEGVDEAVLDELRVLWEQKLQESGVLAAPQQERVRPEPGRQIAVGQSLAHAYPYGIVQSAVNAPNIGRPAAYFPATGPSWQRPAQGPASHTVQTGQAVSGQYTGSQPQLQMTQQHGYQVARPQTQVPYHQHQASAHPQAYRPPAVAQQAYAQQGRPGHPSVQNPANPRPAQQSGYYPPHGGRPYYAYGQPGAPAQLQQHASVARAQNGHTQANNPHQQYRPQTHSGDEVSRKRKAEEEEASHRAKLQMLHQQQASLQQRSHAEQRRLPQQDGPSEEHDSSDKEEEPEKEELENFSDVASSNEEDENFPNQCISQFVKVQRTKQKWKCQLRGGIMHLKGRDFVFGNANGEFQF